MAGEKTTWYRLLLNEDTIAIREHLATHIQGITGLLNFSFIQTFSMNPPFQPSIIATIILGSRDTKKSENDAAITSLAQHLINDHGISCIATSVDSETIYP